MLRQRGRRIRENWRLRSDVQELVDLILQALAAQRRSINGVETKRAVVGATKGAPNSEVLHRNLEDVAQRIDVIASARKAAGRIDRERLRVRVAKRESIACIGI